MALIDNLRNAPLYEHSAPYVLANSMEYTGAAVIMIDTLKKKNHRNQPKQNKIRSNLFRLNMSTKWFKIQLPMV